MTTPWAFLKAEFLANIDCVPARSLWSRDMGCSDSDGSVGGYRERVDRARSSSAAHARFDTSYSLGPEERPD
jgi:hypothetical protein